MGIAEVLEANEKKDLLRFLTCGSVDDGKSTLIGRLLHDSRQIYEDHLSSLEKDSKRVGSAGDSLDYALLMDGLKSEREQGITIDVAYRYFSTPRRKFIIADCPGHVQYTRNMVTGGSTCSLAVVLVDAQQGVLEQTRRHSFLCSLLDIGHVLVAVNKMDLVDYEQKVFEEIRAEYTEFAARLAVRNVHFIPISALRGDNVVERSAKMPWYRGTSLLDHLESVHVASDRNLIDLRYPVQYVLRQDQNFRGYCGTVASGILRPGTDVVVLPSGNHTRVKSVIAGDGEIEEAFPPMAVTVDVEDDVDISRGDILVHPRNVPRVSDEFEAVLVWMDQKSLSLERPYTLKLTSREVRAQVEKLRYRFDVNTLHRERAETLGLNQIGRVKIELARPIAFDPYTRNHSTGSFILVDPVSNGTVAAGMILDRATADQDELLDEDGADRGRQALRPRRSLVSAAERAARLEQRPQTIWLTGLPKAGKSTIAHALERRLFDDGKVSKVLDGENLRLGISENLGFAALERSENVRRAAHIARLMNDAGLIVIVALVSPFEADREAAREVVGEERFFEVHLSAPADVCESRDEEGLYARARKGEIPHFTGVSAPYEAPESPDIELPTHEIELDRAIDRLLEALGPRLAED